MEMGSCGGGNRLELCTYFVSLDALHIYFISLDKFFLYSTLASSLHGRSGVSAGVHALFCVENL